ncbi:hypothetical protein [Streptomyces sp. IMTB 2501]|nr:hypothetical protein [Streptomyces sp. IMTB 2501]
MLGFGALALVVGVTGAVLLRLGRGAIGAVQPALFALLAACTLWTWP